MEKRTLLSLMIVSALTMSGEFGTAHAADTLDTVYVYGNKDKSVIEQGMKAVYLVL